METICPNKTIGTINVGNQLKGKFKIAMLGCSKANFCIGDGAEKKAFMTMLIRRPRHTKFQIKTRFRLFFPFANPKYAIIGAVIPAMISKFLPSKVMSQGIALFRKSQKSTISTGILTIFK